MKNKDRGNCRYDRRVSLTGIVVFGLVVVGGRGGGGARRLYLSAAVQDQFSGCKIRQDIRVWA